MISPPPVRRVNPAPLLPVDCTYQSAHSRLAQFGAASAEYLGILKEAIRRFPSQAAELLREAVPVMDRGAVPSEDSSLLDRVALFFDLTGGDPAEILLLHRGAVPASFAGDTLAVSDLELPAGLGRARAKRRYSFLMVGDVLPGVVDPLRFCAALQEFAGAGYIEIGRQGQFFARETVSPKRWDVLASGNTLYFFERSTGRDSGTEIFGAVAPLRDRLTLPHWVASLVPTEVYQSLYWESGFTVEVHRKDGSITRSGYVAEGKLEELEMADQTAVRDEVPTAAPVVKSPSIRAATPQRRCLFLNTYYEPFLAAAYRTHPELTTMGYEQQLAYFQGCQFGDSDFYEKGLVAAGWEARTVIVNCPQLQQQWAVEQGIRDPGAWEIVVSQIKHYKPDVVYVQDMHVVPTALIRSLTQKGIVVVGQNASDIRSLDVQPYTMLISSLPPYVEYFRSLGKKSYYQPLAFSESVLSSHTACPYEGRGIALSFVGGMADPAHSSRGQLLVALAQQLPIQMWGYGIDSVSADSPIREVYQGEAWGKEMFSLLGNSRITVNMHARWFLPQPDGREATLEYANNMRLFEATGMGALLITDYKPRLEQLFRIGEEVVAYRSVDECISLVRYYLDNPEEAAAIAQKGQQRTLRDHSYGARMAVTAEWLERHLTQTEQLRHHVPPDLRSISTGYRSIDAATAQHSCQHAWKDETIPDKQRSLVIQELEQMYQGSPPRSFTALAELLKGRIQGRGSLLEVGCSSGYYKEILEYLLSAQCCYTGVDISPAMIERARRWYPGGTFLVTEGTELPFGDKTFDVGISGCVLLHDPHYAEQIREICRVSRRYVVAHRTPVSTVSPTQAFHKEGYGVTMVEFRFSEAELLGLFKEQGFEVIQAVVLSQDPAMGSGDVSYLFERTSCLV